MSARASRSRESVAQQDKIPELSCEACNERKVRCDKGNPCSRCQTTGVVCVPIQRKRLPRGRHVRESEESKANKKENRELRERLARLESFIGRNDTSSSSSSPFPSSSISISPAPVTTTSLLSGASAITYPPTPIGGGMPIPIPGVTSIAASTNPNHPSTSNSIPSSNPLTPLFTSPPASTASTASPASLPSSRGKRPVSPVRPSRYLANAFWDDLVGKNPRLHGVLSDQPLDQRHLDDNTSTINRNQNSADRSKPISQQNAHFFQQRAPGSVLALGFGSHSQNPQSYIDAALALRPAPAVCKKLCQVYLDRVDPIIRIFHRPSLMGLLLEGKSYLHYHDNNPVLDVLRSSVFVVAVVSLTEEQCQSLFDVDRKSFVATHRLACEAALDRAGLITTEDITVLQSFVLYLIAIHSNDRSRIAWTLFPIAVRVAIALGLNMDSSHNSESFFEQQMRRRLWYTICLLDLHSSFDRGSEPVIGHRSAHPQLPLNINDSEFQPDSEDCFSDREGLTDMTKALVLYHAQATGKALGVQDEDTPSSAQAMSKATNARQELVEQFELRTRKLLRYCDPESSPYAWSAFNGSLATLATMQLSFRRPLNHNGRRGIAMDTDPTNILRLATTVLERDIIMRSDSRGEPFRWFSIVHWHPLAVAIAECYVCDNVAVLRHVWPTIETSFEYIGKVLAEYRQGMLWKPVEKLMLKTRSRIHALLEQINSATYTGMSDFSAYMDPPAALDSSAYGRATMPLSTSPTSICFTSPAVAPASVLTPTMLTQNIQEGRMINAQVDASCRQMTPSKPLQTAAMSAQENQGAWMVDNQADASFWQQVTPSMSDAGWDAWDGFLNNFNVDWNDEMMVV